MRHINQGVLHKKQEVMLNKNRKLWIGICFGAFHCYLYIVHFPFWNTITQLPKRRKQMHRLADVAHFDWKSQWFLHFLILGHS